MGIAMVALARTKSGRWASRKVIPSDVRDAYGKREEKKTWPPSLSEEQAKAELGAWLSPIEERISLLRAAKSAVPVTLTARQCRSIAGDWYKALSEAEEEKFTEGVGEWDWDADIDSIVGPNDGVPLRPIPFVLNERERVLAERGLTVTPDTAERLLQDMLSLYLDFLRLMERRVAGDFGADPVIDTLPAPESVSVAQGVSLRDLFADYAKTGSAAPRTVLRWQGVVDSFIDYLGHANAEKVTRSDVYGWFEALRQQGLSVSTITRTYRAAVSRIYRIGVDKGLLSINPAAGVEVIGPKKAETRPKALSDTEAKIILKAASGPQPEGLSEHHARARRWVPWICAYTGARVNEITQLRAMDIRKEDGVWAFRITPDAGSVKTRKARSVPIHSHLIEQGITDLAKAGDKTPLFYNSNGAKSGSGNYPLYAQMGSKLAKWVRELGVTEVQSPNHGWRHRFKTIARRVGMDPEARDAIQGHAPRTEDETYGEYPLGALKEELEKVPRYIG